MNNSRHGLTTKIAHFLTRLLQPIYDHVCHRKTFNTGADALDAIENYAKHGFLRPNTLFATVHINNLCTIFPHEQTIAALQRFLYEFIIDGRVQGITIQSIIDLVRFFLENQYFLYDNKLYRQIRGSGFHLSLTKLLANIYIYYWQLDLVTMLENNNEIFGR